MALRRVVATLIVALVVQPLSAQSNGQGRGRHGSVLTFASVRPTVAPAERAVFYAVHLNTTGLDQRPIVTCPYRLEGIELRNPESACDIPESLAPGDSAWIRLEGHLPSEPGRYTYASFHGGGRGGSGFDVSSEVSPEDPVDPMPRFLTRVWVEDGVDRLRVNQLERLLAQAFSGVRIHNVPASDSAIAVLSDRYRVLEIGLVREGPTGLLLRICPRLRPSQTRPSRCQRASSLPTDTQDLYLGAEIMGRLRTALQRYAQWIERAEVR